MPDPGLTLPVVFKHIPRVFETFKPPWELFRLNPGPWSEVGVGNPCFVPISNGDMVLGSTSKFSDILQASVKGLGGALIAQNRTYVHYSTGFKYVLVNGKLTVENGVHTGMRNGIALYGEGKKD